MSEANYDRSESVELGSGGALSGMGVWGGSPGKCLTFCIQLKLFEATYIIRYAKVDKIIL